MGNSFLLVVKTIDFRTTFGLFNVIFIYLAINFSLILLFINNKRSQQLIFMKKNSPR